MLKKFFHQFASPKSYFRIATKIQNPFLLIFVLLYVFALAWGLLFTPEDYIQGNSYRIIFMHVPASFVSQILFLIMAFCSVIFLVWRLKLSIYVAKSIAPIGAKLSLSLLFFWIYMGNSNMGNMVAMGCKNNIDIDFTYNVSGINFTSLVI